MDATGRTLDAEAEQALVRRAVDGDERAFAALYDHYLDKIYRFMAYRVADDATAEDLTSEVFLRAWDNLDGYKPGGPPFGAWLFRIARNLAIDHARTRKDATPLEAVADMLPDADPGPAEQAACQLEAQRLRRALNQLTDLQRDVLSLKFIQGMETREVARVLGKRPGAVRALQMRGLQALAEVLGHTRTESDD